MTGLRAAVEVVVARTRHGHQPLRPGGERVDGVYGLDRGGVVG